MVKISNTLKAVIGALFAAGTYAVTQTKFSGTAKDIIYVVLVFVSFIIPGLELPASPQSQKTTETTPNSQYDNPPA